MIERLPFDFNAALANGVRPVLRDVVEGMLDWKPS